MAIDHVKEFVGPGIVFLCMPFTYASVSVRGVLLYLLLNNIYTLTMHYQTRILCYKKNLIKLFRNIEQMIGTELISVVISYRCLLTGGRESNPYVVEAAVSHPGFSSFFLTS